MGVINSQSIRNKTEMFQEEIVDAGYDFCGVTETWLTQGDDVIRTAISPPGYSFLDIFREGRRGGGTGLICRDSFKPKFSASQVRTTYEHSEWDLTFSSNHFHVVVIYRPPRSINNNFSIASFIEEFGHHVEELITTGRHLIILGDLNIHLDVLEDCNTKNFQDLLQSFGLKNHVDFPTHKLGHNLDVFITKTDCRLEISDITAGRYLSDHCFVTVKFQVIKPPVSSVKKSFRKLKGVDIELFKQDILNSQLHRVDFDEISLDGLVDLFLIMSQRIYQTLIHQL